jgi:DNA-binding NtrC family response regulator
VVSAGDSLEAMRVIAQTPSLGLVFTDIVLPGLDGILLADMVKQHKPKLKILYTTGKTDIHQIKADAGIIHGNILTKPYVPEQLRSHIKELLG